MSTPPSERNAYVTLITRASYLPGVVILADTLRRHGNQSPLVVLYTSSLSDAGVKALKLEAPKQNLIPKLCQDLLPPKGSQITLIAERFRDTWTKLRAFELFEFDTVCFLDADMAVFGRIESVFHLRNQFPRDWIIANHSCVCNRGKAPWAPDDWCPENCAYTCVSHPAAIDEPTQPSPDGPRTHQILNGGMFVFSPTEDMWTDMMSYFNTTPLLSSFMFPDQDFLAHFFKEKWRAIGWRYNALKTMRYNHGNIWRDDAVLSLHYIVDKPWTKRVGPDGVAGYKGRDGVTHQWWWDAYNKWEAERCAETTVLQLVRKGVAPPAGVVDGWLKETDPDVKAIGSDVQGFANNRVPITQG
ncbi:nucleotide-diphospho-sugar transferase [Apiospora phragmitis]|uniref:Nucleotide-diphospho-sugar transferase n=1 Tax=Apiospora phragmitis TaxID=2905665 RepID=A0ABR1X731_9PEZI